MITAATRAMNASTHTLGDLRTFAQTEPDEAGNYLRSVKQNFAASGRQLPAAVATAIDAILTGPANELDNRIQTNAAALTQFFPEQAQAWAQLQAQRAQSIGWTAGQTTAVHAMTGKLDAAAFTLTTPAGAVYKLAPAPGPAPLPAAWMRGFGADGDAPLTVRGLLGSDGKTFLVEDYAPGTSTDYTSGRTDQSNPAIINTPRGPVRITDPTFLARVQRLPRLGVILPGAPVKQGNELVYAGNPEKFYALGRFRTFPTANPEQAAATRAQQQVTAAQTALTRANTNLQGAKTALEQGVALITTSAQAAVTARANVTTAAQATEVAAAAETPAGEVLQAANDALAAAQAAMPVAGQPANPTAQAALTAAQQQVAAATQALTQAATKVTQSAQALIAAQQAANAATQQQARASAQRPALETRVTQMTTAAAQAQTAFDVAQAALTQAQAQLTTPPDAATRVYTGATGDFAYSVVASKPINIRGSKEAARANHADRMWALGNFTFNASNVALSFEVEYLSLALGGSTMPNAAPLAADEWLSAVVLTEAGVTPPETTPISADFARHTP